MNLSASFLNSSSAMMSMIFLVLVAISFVSCKHIQKDLADSERVKRAACSFTYSNANGIILSHSGYRRTNYNDNTDCTYTIQSNGTVYLSFDEVSIEYNRNCIYDYIQVNGERICGDARKTFVFNNVQGSIQFNFHSDGSVTSRGFRASYSTDNDNCRVRTTASSGVLTSPRSGYNNNQYGNKLDCDYIINNNGVNDIILSIEMFDVEYQFSCGYDALELPSQYITQSKLCGTINSGRTYRLRNVNGPTTLRFTSDSSVTRAGFRLSYNIVPSSNSSGSTNYTTSYPGGYNSTNSSNWNNYTSPYPGGYNFTNYTTSYPGGYNSTNSSNWNNYNGSYSGYNNTDSHSGYNYTTSYPGGYNSTNSSYWNNYNSSYPGYNYTTSYPGGYNYTNSSDGNNNATSYLGYNYTTSLPGGYNSTNSSGWYYSTTSYPQYNYTTPYPGGSNNTNSSNWNNFTTAYPGVYNFTNLYPGGYNYTISGYNYTTSGPSNGTNNYPNFNSTTWSK